MHHGETPLLQKKTKKTFLSDYNNVVPQLQSYKLHIRRKKAKWKILQREQEKKKSEEGKALHFCQLKPMSQVPVKATVTDKQKSVLPAALVQK